jgi:RNase P subunit RPR2
MTSPWKRQLDFEVPASRCPSCGDVLNGAGEAVTRHGEAPRIGDITICLHCAAVNRYGIGLVLEAVTGDELTVLLADPDCRDVLRLVNHVRGNRK